jgi:hypothetical protein
LEMRQLSCFVGVEKLDRHPKSAAALQPLLATCRTHLAAVDLTLAGKTA